MRGLKTLKMKIDWDAEWDMNYMFIITHNTDIYCTKPAFRAYTKIHRHRILLTLLQHPALLADLCHLYQNLIKNTQKNQNSKLQMRK